MTWARGVGHGCPTRAGLGLSLEASHAGRLNSSLKSRFKLNWLRRRSAPPKLSAWILSTGREQFPGQVGCGTSRSQKKTCRRVHVRAIQRNDVILQGKFILHRLPAKVVNENKSCSGRSGEISAGERCRFRYGNPKAHQDDVAYGARVGQIQKRPRKDMIFFDKSRPPCYTHFN